jgi:hypothetical protein
VLRLVTILAVLAVLVVPAGRGAPPPPQLVCVPFPAALQGSYYRYDDRSWELTFNADCTYQARQHANVEGGGNYTQTDSEVIVLSNDTGCRDPGVQDLPTPYDYFYEHGLLMLGPQGGIAADLCVNSKGEGRAQDIAGHGGWIKAVAGKVTLSVKGARKGSFVLSGAMKDIGSFRVAHSKTKKGVTTSTLRFTGQKGTFALVEHVKKGKATWDLTGKGGGGYRNLGGSGKGTARATKQTLRGDVSN